MKVSEQPHTREQLQAILESVADGITVQDTRGQLVYVNQAGAEIMGFANPEEVLAITPSEILARFELMDDQNKPMPLTELPGRKTINGHKEASKLIGFKNMGADEVRWSVVRARPIYDETGEVEFAVNVFQDITDLKNAQIRLTEANTRITKLLERTLDS